MTDERIGEVEQHGVDRRTLIRRAVAVGAAAWTAPVIIESIASPASAATVPPTLQGCNFISFNSNCNSNNQSSCATPNGCPTGANAALSQCLQVTGGVDGCKTQVTVDLVGVCAAASCYISTISAQDAGNNCVSTPYPLGTKHVVINAPMSSTFNQFSVYVTCT
jgi:hypothetical protein